MTGIEYTLANYTQVMQPYVQEFQFQFLIILFKLIVKPKRPRAVRGTWLNAEKNQN